ncbi:MAG: hypothetical protein J6R29_02750 [Clostridia bacterium]|nr:hypothetical protein [Clostridia bacterium]
MNILNYAKKGKVDFYNLTTLQGVSTEDIIEIINTATELKHKRSVQENSILLKDKYVLLVTKPNLPRSSITFQLAIKELSGSPVITSMHGEELENLLKDKHYVKALTSFGLSAVVVCTSKTSDSKIFIDNVSVPVINATAVESPCEALSALMTIAERFKDFKNLNVTIVGNSVEGDNSLAIGLVKLGANVTFLSTNKTVVDDGLMKYLSQFSYVTVTDDKLSALKSADVVYFLSKDENLTVLEEDLQNNNKDYIVLSSLPVDTTMASQNIFDGNNSYVTKQTENLLHVGKAVLSLTYLKK